MFNIMKVRKIIYFLSCKIHKMSVLILPPQYTYISWGEGIVRNETSDYCNLLKYVWLLDMLFNRLFYFKIKSQYTDLITIIF